MEEQAGRIRVVIVDDHPAIRSALASAITSEHQIFLCGEAGTVAEAMDIIPRLEPDVAIVDISLSDGHGLDLIGDVHARCPDVQMVVYSMFEERIYAERAIRAGALAYVAKTGPTRQVVEAILSVSRGEVYVSRRTASRMLQRLAKVGDSTASREDIDELTDREIVVFHMLGEGLVVDEIAERLNLSRKTVEAYRRSARQKLGFENVTQLIRHGHDWLAKHI